MFVKEISHSWFTYTNKLYMLHETLLDWFSLHLPYSKTILPVGEQKKLKYVTAGTTKNMLHSRCTP